MAFDGFITKSVVSELKKSIIGAKVNKVYEPTKNEVVLSLYNSGKNYNLNLCANPEFCRICLTNYSKPNPQNALNFCMLLRKYLVGGKIVNISNYDLERTVEIQFECYNELNDLVVRKLFIEIMSRQSNIILTNEKNIIIDTLKHFDNNSRDLLPAHEYTFTPINKISFLEIKSFEEFLEIMNTSGSIVSLTKFFIDTFIGFSKPFVKENLKSLSISDSEYSEDDLRKFYNYLKDLINNFGTQNIYCKKISEKDYTLVFGESTEPDEEDLTHINYFIDDFYYNKEQDSLFTNSRNNLLKIVSASLKKVYKKMENINSKLKECEKMDTYRLYGELLTANLYKFTNSPNLSEVTVENYYDNNNLITIPLDNSLNVNKNIEKYFKKYNKLKNALSIVSEQKRETVKELDYIESIVFNLSTARNLNDINGVYEELSQNVVTKKAINKKEKNNIVKKQESNKIELESVVIDGYTVYIGKNNMQNDYLSLRFANPNDVWFHAQKIHGSHVLLRNSENLELDEIPENVLFNCARLAKENSKAENSLNVSVDYCLAKFVKKASGAKPGMVIYNNFKTIIVK
ncbi:MAG: NFACT family protein [Clostridia bacterium]|nr:NFACT family protein [Clostridia bacterium]